MSQETPALLQVGQTQLPWEQKNSGTVNHKLDPQVSGRVSALVVLLHLGANLEVGQVKLMEKSFCKVKGKNKHYSHSSASCNWNIAIVRAELQLAYKSRKIFL